MSRENDSILGQMVPHLPGYTPPDEQNLTISQMIPQMTGPVVHTEPSVLSAIVPDRGGDFSNLRSIAREAIPEVVEEETFDDKIRNTFYQISYDDYADARLKESDEDEVDLSDNETKKKNVIHDELNHSSVSIVLEADNRKRLDDNDDNEDSLSVVIHPTLDRNNQGLNQIMAEAMHPTTQVPQGIHGIMVEATGHRIPAGEAVVHFPPENAIISAIIPINDDSVIDLDRSETSQQVHRTVVLAEMLPRQPQKQQHHNEPAFISVNQPKKDENVKKGIGAYLGPFMQRIQPKKKEESKLKQAQSLDPNDPIALELSNIAAITAQVMQAPSPTAKTSKKQQPQISHHQQQTPGRPNDYIEYSILNTLCCCICIGLPAIFFSVNTRQANNDPSKRETAVKSSTIAKWLNIAAFVIGLIVWMIVLIVILAETTKKK